MTGSLLRHWYGLSTSKGMKIRLMLLTIKIPSCAHVFGMGVYGQYISIIGHLSSYNRNTNSFPAVSRGLGQTCLGRSARCTICLGSWIIRRRIRVLCDYCMRQMVHSRLLLSLLQDPKLCQNPHIHSCCDSTDVGYCCRKDSAHNVDKNY